MIAVETVQRLATKYQTTALNVVREYCQHLFLSAFYQRPASDHVLFKGGTALRILYGSPRFSEDLDFSGVDIRASAVEHLLTETLSDVERSGLVLEIEEAKATSGGYLGILHSRVLEYRVAIQVEVSLRARTRLQASTALIAGDFLPAYTVLHLPQEALVEEKLRALLERGKSRDFYDLYFILRKGLLTPAARRILREVPPRLKRVKPEAFNELRLFLPKHQHSLVKDFRVTLARELQRHVGSR